MPVNELNTLFIGKVLFEFQSLESTNVRAQELLAKSKPIEGTAISAIEQYAGKGQFGSQWVSAPGENITLSIILYPTFLHPSKQFLLNRAIALGVYDFCRLTLRADLKIKWPNDIYIRDQKTGGILIQNTITAHSLSSSIVGIGLNINQTEFHPDLPNPTSWKKVTDKHFRINEIRQTLFWCLETRYLQLRAGNYDQLKSDYLAALYRYAEVADFAAHGAVFSGKITGVSDTGLLEIVDESGALRKFDFKEVRFLFSDQEQ